MAKHSLLTGEMYLARTSLTSYSVAFKMMALGEMYPREPFGDSCSVQRALLVILAQSFHKKTKTWNINRVFKTLIPAKPGDMLWIFEMFFQELYNPENGLIFNVGSPSETEMSAYRALLSFCRRKEYRHHPYWRTLLAFAYATDTDIAKRNLKSNIMHVAIHTLAACKEEKQSMRLKCIVHDSIAQTSTYEYTVRSVDDFYRSRISGDEPNAIKDGDEENCIDRTLGTPGDSTSGSLSGRKRQYEVEYCDDSVEGIQHLGSNETPSAEGSLRKKLRCTKRTWTIVPQIPGIMHPYST